MRISNFTEFVVNIERVARKRICRRVSRQCNDGDGIRFVVIRIVLRNCKTRRLRVEIGALLNAVYKDAVTRRAVYFLPLDRVVFKRKHGTCKSRFLISDLRCLRRIVSRIVRRQFDRPVSGAERTHIERSRRDRLFDCRPPIRKFQKIALSVLDRIPCERILFFVHFKSRRLFKPAKYGELFGDGFRITVRLRRNAEFDPRFQHFAGGKIKAVTCESNVFVFMPRRSALDVQIVIYADRRILRLNG